MAEREEELKSLSKVKEEIEKIGLKLNMPKTKIMVSNPILHGKLLEKKWKQWKILFFWTPKSLWMVSKLKDACSLEEKL